MHSTFASFLPKQVLHSVGISFHVFTALIHIQHYRFTSFCIHILLLWKMHLYRWLLH